MRYGTRGCSTRRARQKPGILLALLLAFSAAGSLFAGEKLSMDEKESILALLTQQSARVKSLFVKGDSFQGGKRVAFEWAVSGEERYRKQWWPAPVDAPLPKRWDLAVWDGKLLKAYDSELENGSVRAEYDPKNPTHATTYTDYCQFLGTLSTGTLVELLTKADITNWGCAWVDQGKKAVIELNRGSPPVQLITWNVDMTRGGLITEGTIARRLDGKVLPPFLSWKVLESREAMPGLWLPTKGQIHADFADIPGRGRVVLDKEVVVSELKVNDPATQDKFSFTFPEGAMYYDHSLHSSMTVRQGQAEVSNPPSSGASTKDTQH